MTKENKVEVFKHCKGIFTVASIIEALEDVYALTDRLYIDICDRPAIRESWNELTIEECEDVIKEMWEADNKLLAGYNTTNNLTRQAVKNVLDKKKLLTEVTTYKYASSVSEWCQHCEKEVELMYSHGHCPMCGELLVSCAMCEISGNCGHCFEGSKFELAHNVNIEVTEL